MKSHYTYQDDHELPEGWEMHFDSSTSAVFYHNATSQETQWERPLCPHSASTSSHTEVISQALDHIMDSSLQRNKKQQQLQPIQGAGKYQSQLQGNQPQQQQQQLMESPPKRTMVRIKSKKMAALLKHKNKIYVDENQQAPHDVTDTTTHGNISSNSAQSSNSHSKSHSPSASQSHSNSASAASMEPAEGGKSQDYLGLVQIYNLQRPFLRRDHTINCVLCQRVVPEDIFFPCEHKVVCRACIKKEEVCPDYELDKFPNGHCNCPLCCQIIKLILPNENGKEVEKYWAWVLAVKPELPKGFMRDFRHSAAIIQKIHIDENAMLRDKKNRNKCTFFCVIS
jgi:hypothetical protein